jgi:hypothetical protein
MQLSYALGISRAQIRFLDPKCGIRYNVHCGHSWAFDIFPAFHMFPSCPDRVFEVVQSTS